MVSQQYNVGEDSSNALKSLVRSIFLRIPVANTNIGAAVSGGGCFEQVLFVITWATK